MSKLRHLIAARIAAGRKEKRWTQTDAANMLGISQNVWSTYETGSVNIPIDTLERISEILEKPIEFFVVADYQYTVKAPTELPLKKARRRRDPANVPAR